ncbi:MAG: ABC transporter ATP-binding protein [Spirochaetales bacterium]|nr:ABC transporter ATP-binding protein [Spirochaetales bacterium]
MGRRSAFGFLGRYVKKYGGLFILAVLFLSLETFCDLLQPTLMARIIDKGVASKDMQTVMGLGAFMLLVTALGAVGAILRNILANLVSLRFSAELRGDLFRKILGFPFGTADHFETASLVTRLTNDVTQVQNFVSGMMRILLKAPLLCIGSIIMAVLLNPHLAVILYVVVPVVIVLIVLSARMGYPLFASLQTMIDRINGVSREYLAGVRVVKAFNSYEHEAKRFNKANNELSDISIRTFRVLSVFSPLIMLTINAGIVAVLWFGGVGINEGSMQVGQVIAFTNYMTQILGSLMLIAMLFNVFVRAKASAERITEVLVQEAGMTVPAIPTAPSETGCGIEFDHVTFAYGSPPGEPVLRDISFQCTRGEKVGIIGSTGSGKTSLVNLVPRLYDTTSGSVWFQGVDVREMDPAELRSNIALVPQKSVLFTGTILANILWGRKEADRSMVERAARAAQAHEFITSFPNGYNTILGQGGVNLSGGQKQRIAIARALVREPAILILDDSTSAVDAVTENHLWRGIKEYAAEMTCLVITQRIATAISSDRIVVLDEGVIQGIGSHADLLASCPVYKDIYRSQIGDGGA